MAGAGGTVETRYNSPQFIAPPVRVLLASPAFLFPALARRSRNFERLLTRFFFNADDRPDDARFALLGDLGRALNLPEHLFNFFSQRGYLS
jgi:hypothetical protein